MRSASVDLTAHLAQPVTTMCLCFKITRDDGVQYFITGHDVSLVIDGDTYLPKSCQFTSVDVKSGLSVDNAELTLPITK